MLFFPTAIDVTAKRQIEGISNGALDAVPPQVCLDGFLILLICNHYRSELKRLQFFFYLLIGILLFEVELSAHFAKLRTLFSLMHPFLLGTKDNLALGAMFLPRIRLVLFGWPDYDSQNVKIRSFLRFID
jgi:hypothetical protein